MTTPISHAKPAGQHTTLPWRVEDHSFSIYADGAPNGPMRIADMRGWGYLTGKGQCALGLPDDDALAIQKANAAFIVEAVNSHASLKARNEELEERAWFLLDRLEEFDPGDDEPEREFHGHVTPAIARLRAILQSKGAA